MGVNLIKNNKKDVIFNNKNILKILLIIVIALVIRLVFMYAGAMDSEEYIVNNINIILGFMSIVSCFLFYDEDRKDQIFLMGLLYISFLVDLIMGNIDNITYLTFIIDYRYGEIILNSILRIILVTIIIFSGQKFNNFIYKNKYVTVFAIVLISIFFNILESNLGFLKSFKNLTFYLNITIMLFIFNVVMTCILIRRALHKDSFIYTILICSLAMLSVQHLYTIAGLLNINLDLRVEKSLITALTSILIILGALFKLKLKIDKAEELEDNISIFYKFIDSSNTKVLICDNKWNVLYCNKAVKGQYKSIEEMRNINNNKVIFKILKNNTINTSKKLDRDVIKYINDELYLNKNWNGVLKVEDCDDKVRIYRCNMQVIDISNDSRYIVSYNDITTEYLFRNELFEADEKFELLSSNIKDTIIILNKEEKIEYINKSGMKLLEYEYKDLLGKEIDDYIIDSVICKQGNIKQEIIMENSVISKSGKKIQLETIKSPIMDVEGNISGWTLVARDMSYTKALKNIKNKYKEIKDYQEIKNEFFANLSHELRTPTNIIYSSIQLLNSRLEIDDRESFINFYNKYSGVLKQNCFRILRLINNMIDISKVEAGYIDLELKNYDIISFIEDITISFIPYVESKNINIVFDTEFEELEVQFDEEKLERVLLNLLSNAIKYTDKNGNILVKVTVENEWVKIIVKDDGIGIPKEMREVIFNRFVQVNKSLNRLKEGSGIGLALVKSIIELHNGKVYIANNDDKGSEFVVLLPNAIKESEERINLIESSKPMKEKIAIELSDIYDI